MVSALSSRHSTALTSVEACLRVVLKSDSGSGGTASARETPTPPKALRPPLPNLRPNGWAESQDTGVGVFGMCWRRGAGAHVPIWGRLSWRWTQVCGEQIIGAWGDAVLHHVSSLDKMKRPNQVHDGQEACAISWRTWMCNAMPSLRAGETVIRPAIMSTPGMTISFRRFV